MWDTSPKFSKVQVKITVGITDDGIVYFTDSDGVPLPENLVKVAKKQHADQIRGLLQKKCDEINALFQALGKIHLSTPDPLVHKTPKSQYQIQEYSVQHPTKPIPQRLGLWESVLDSVPFRAGRRSKRKKIEKENADSAVQYEEALKTWHTEKQRFDEEENLRKDLADRLRRLRIYTDVKAMETFLNENLQHIVWPLETIVSTEILDGGKHISAEVKVPKIEYMPAKKVSVPVRGYKPIVKALSAAERQRLYKSHIHGIGFRVIGEIFASIPSAHVVGLSASSQRTDRSTGQVGDEIVYAVRVARGDWSRINFSNLQGLDVVEALAQFEFLRNPFSG